MEQVKLTKQQQAFVSKHTEHLDCIYIGVGGSVSYGLNTHTSDVDVKAVFVPTLEQLIMGSHTKTKQLKEAENDIEMEVMGLDVFLNGLCKSDTNCLDMLHNRNSMILYQEPLWVYMHSERHHLYAKNMKGMVGYIKTHAKKYSRKIDRFDEMTALDNWLSDYYDDARLKDIPLELFLEEDVRRYVEIGTQFTDHEQAFLEVCGKKYTLTWTVMTLRAALKKELAVFGDRTRLGSEKGLDTKSLSHAYRMLLQLDEIVHTRDIKFPLVYADKIMPIKLGDMEVEDVLDILDTTFEIVMRDLDNSNLPEFNNMEPFYTVVKEYYVEMIDNESKGA